MIYLKRCILFLFISCSIFFLGAGTSVCSHSKTNPVVIDTNALICGKKSKTWLDSTYASDVVANREIPEYTYGADGKWESNNFVDCLVQWGEWKRRGNKFSVSIEDKMGWDSADFYIRAISVKKMELERYKYIYYFEKGKDTVRDIYFYKIIPEAKMGRIIKIDSLSYKSVLKAKL